PPHARSDRRLCGRLKPRAADRPLGAVCLGTGSARLHEAHVDSGLHAYGAGRTGRRNGDTGGNRGAGGSWPLGIDKAQRLMDRRPFDPDTDRIVTVTLDPNTITSIDPDEVHEWRIAIYDLVDSNRFRPARVKAEGPYALHLSIVHNHIVLDVRHPETFRPIAAH